MSAPGYDPQQPGDPTRLQAWQTLEKLAAQAPRLPALLDADPERFERYRIGAPHMLLDLSRQRMDAPVRDALLALAEARHVIDGARQLFTENQLNPTEGRAVLHTALRAKAPVHLDGHDVTTDVARVHTQMRQLVQAVHRGGWTGLDGQSLTDVVHIGIGGSYLGPALLCEALETDRLGRLRVHFLANVDGFATSRLLARLDPARTLFVIASKSFGTMETRVTAETARAWFLERGSEPDIARHFVAVSTNVEAASAFGIPPENLFELWDWVGGRFSVWSAIGLPIALGLGFDVFERLLAGARAMDDHFLNAPVAANAPLALALAGIWNHDFLGCASHAVLPYANALAQLPNYLQQLEMESNGKRVRSDGAPVSTGTAPIIWGGVGTNGQHAFHQLLHQGTRAFSADFVLPMQADHPLPGHHRWLAAHCFAQAEALARGRARHACEQALMADGMDADAAQRAAPHREVPGNHPSTTIALDAITPEALGALLALYEHKVACQGMIWGLDSFDQWGVELGKRLGDDIHAALEAPKAHAEPADPSTRGLVEHFRAYNGP